MNTKLTLSNRRGFTLVELMIVVLLTAIAVIAIYRGYTAFSHSADAQEQIIEMQQNLRIGMHILTKDIMRAGMKEEDDTLVAFVNAGSDSVEFVMDLGSDFVAPDTNLFATDDEDNDGDLVTDDPADSDAATAALEAEEESRIGDGDVDDPGERIIYSRIGDDLRREVNGATQTIITNVSALNFIYLDVNGDPTAVLKDIDTVEITMVVRTTNEDSRITNNDTYINQLGTWSWSAPGDHFRRRAMSMRVKIRNAQLPKE